MGVRRPSWNVCCILSDANEFAGASLCGNLELNCRWCHVAMAVIATGQHRRSRFQQPLSQISILFKNVWLESCMTSLLIILASMRVLLRASHATTKPVSIVLTTEVKLSACEAIDAESEDDTFSRLMNAYHPRGFLEGMLMIGFGLSLSRLTRVS